MNYKYQYRIPENCEDSYYHFECDWKPSSYNHSSIAQIAAEDFHSNHDGWEFDWPLEIELFTIEGERLGLFSVEMEAVPRFSATEMKGKK